MSHIVSPSLVITDKVALVAAVERINAKFVKGGEVMLHEMYNKANATGIGVQLAGWRYPVVFDIEAGTCFYDNFNGKWGDQSFLDELCLSYTIEASINAAMLADPLCYSTEEVLENGDVLLTLQSMDA